MLEYRIKGSTLTNIADAIREKTGSTNGITVGEMANGVNDVYEAGTKVGNLVEESAIGLLTVPYINENEHEIEVKLSSDTITDFSNIEVKVLEENLIPYPYVDTTKTLNGITFTDNGDGTITVNGTATADARFNLCNANTINYTGTRMFTLSGCPKGGSSTTYRLRMSYSQNMSDYGTAYTYGGFYSYEINPIIEIKNGTTVNNLIFKPQLTRRDRLLIDDFHPYRKTVFKAEADGTVRGIMPESQTVNLLTNKDITITCKSNKVSNYDWHLFWDSYQSGGFRSSWTCAFSYGWYDSAFNPKYPIIGSSSYGLQQAFRNSDMTEIQVPVIDRIGNISTAFNYCGQLKRIALLKFDKPLTTVNASAFANCYSLVELNIEGEIACNGLTLQYSTRLNHDSIVGIINALSTTTTGLAITLSLTAVNNAFETSEGAADGSTSAEWEALVATKSNWTISLV